MLSINHVFSGYEHLQVLWDVTMDVQQGEFVALIGPNGAGKTTTLRTIAGLIIPRQGEIEFQGRTVNSLPAHQIQRLGISFVTEDLNLFEGMSVYENLLLGAFTRRDRRALRDALERVFALFPVLSERQKQLAGTLSGGERRMLAVGRGLMSTPHLILVDEPSLGLAPRAVQAVFNALQELHQSGVTILLVEQNVTHTLRVTDKAYLLEQGRIILHGPSRDLLSNAYLKDTYLGAR